MNAPLSPAGVVPESNAPAYPVGTQFIARHGRIERLCTVADYWVTRNLAGEVVRARYVATHPLLGQLVADHDVCAVTIARGIARLKELGQ